MICNVVGWSMVFPHNCRGRSQTAGQDILSAGCKRQRTGALDITWAKH